LEATLATEVADARMRGDRRVDEVIDAINAIPSPDFLLHVTRRGRPPSRQPSSRQVVRQVNEWIATLSAPARARGEREISGFEELPSLEIVLEAGPEEADEPSSWLLIRASARRSPKPGGSALGSISDGVRKIELAEAVRQSLKRKASRYGRLGAPYVIAVSARMSLVALDRELCEEALFGDISFAPQDQGDFREVRTPNGFWRGPEGPQNTRVSAVLIVGNLDAWNLAQRHQQPVLYLSPWAEFPYDGPLARLPTGRFNEAVGRVSYTAGLHPRELFGLNERWPLSQR
jgi:hypothetical protein